MWAYNWQIGATNRFIINAWTEDQKTAYTAWIHVKDTWKKLATFRTRTGGLPLNGYYSFIEDFRRDGKSAREVRRARFGNGWIKVVAGGEWVPLARARFTASDAEWESRDNIDAGAQDGSFFLATGGDTSMSRELRSLIDLPAIAARRPRVLDTFPSEVPVPQRREER
jgi:hypothetical protein